MASRNPVPRISSSSSFLLLFRSSVWVESERARLMSHGLSGFGRISFENVGRWISLKTNARPPARLRNKAPEAYHVRGARRACAFAESGGGACVPHAWHVPVFHSESARTTGISPKKRERRVGRSNPRQLLGRSSVWVKSVNARLIFPWPERSWPERSMPQR